MTTLTISKRALKRMEKEKWEQKKNIFNSFPIRFSKNDIAMCTNDTAMKWWYIMDINKKDHTVPTYLLAVNIDNPDIIYEKRINCFWFYICNQGLYDYWYDINLDEDENGVCTKVNFTDMFKHTYSYTNNLKCLENMNVLDVPSDYDNED